RSLYFSPAPLTEIYTLSLHDALPILSYCIEQFGPERSMFESNFPVDKVSFSHHVLWNAFKRFSRGYSAGERAQLCHVTAVRAYRDRKSTRLNSSHDQISYAVFCLKKK